MSDPHAPFVIAATGTPADPAAAPPIIDEEPAGAAPPPRRPSRLVRTFAATLGALVTLMIATAIWRFVAALFSAEGWLGWAALALVVLAGALFAALILREGIGLARLRRLDRLRTDADAAWQAGDLAAARALSARLRALYAHRPDLSWALSRLAEQAPALIDADALLAQVESEVIAPLDARAQEAVESAVRQVATITAIVPLALADVAVALYANLAMIRRIAMIYGGRGGAFASLRLLRKVMAALVAAGIASLADDMMASVAGGGLLSKLSRRFGEGVVNGALTARIGIAAIEMCRPLPFRSRPRPRVPALVTRALRGLMPKGG